jgi:hypothetical protein
MRRHKTTHSPAALEFGNIAKLTKDVARIRAGRSAFSRGKNIKPPTFIVNGVDIRD